LSQGIPPEGINLSLEIYINPREKSQNISRIGNGESPRKCTRSNGARIKSALNEIPAAL